ncbi:arsenate reductase [Melissococcus plutonius]|uniref:Arsenate reductase n=2 Tax=Melissococcus plutonius TaxID=33970 RepID=F3YBU1_MELPT|nr:arsenate reductase [Melissococcus plutonius S1]KMT23925.1 arsenate reductase [Melissococcus plutonius]BAK21969.1 arsenate reductase [Melissococcus plutonius ATCC 35311]BAL61775.1 arsenate reductase [Melissococcus plutonius DAT561]KMT24448.1 arsenate reductase [Melissococcus plutonius]
MYILYWYPKCSTCQKAKKWLDKKNIEYRTVDMIKNPPSEQLLATWMEEGEQPLRKFFNTSGQHYREQGLKEKVPNFSITEASQCLSKDGMLIKRPILSKEDRFLINGFNEAKYEEVIRNTNINRKIVEEILWVAPVDNGYRIGLTNQAQDELGKITYATFPKPGQTIVKGESLIELEAEKSVSEYESPLTGTIHSINEAAAEDSSILDDLDEEKLWIVTLTEVAKEQFDQL